MFNTYYTRVVLSIGLAYPMQRKLTITIDDQVYQGLYQVIGPGKISKFIEKLVRPHVLDPDLESEYQEMAMDEHSEVEALEWIEGLTGELEDETW